MAFSGSQLIITYFLLILIPSAAPISFNLTNISPENQNKDIVIEGDRAYISDNGIQVTANGIGSNRSLKAGQATYIRPFHLWDNKSREIASFSTNFIFSTDANGLTFFLAQNNSVISSGGVMGLPVNATTNCATNPFVSVKFDIYPNDGDQIDSNNASIGVHVSITISSLTFARHKKWFGNITSGRVCQAWITYDTVSKNLSVSFTGFQNNTVVRHVELVCTVDLRTVLPQSVVFGFSRANRVSFKENNVRFWSFSGSDLQVDGNITVPPNPNLTLLLNDPVDDKNKKVKLVFGVLRRRKKKKKKSEELGFDIVMNNESGMSIEPKRSSYKKSPRSTRGFSATNRASFKKNNVRSWSFSGPDLQVDGNIAVPPSPSLNPNLTQLLKHPVDDKNKKIKLLVGVLRRRRRRKKKKSEELGFVIVMDNDSDMSTEPKRFSYKEVPRTTNEFLGNEKLGEGGFSGVHRSFLKDPTTYNTMIRVLKSSNVVGKLTIPPTTSPSPSPVPDQDLVDDNNSKAGLIVGLLVAVSFLVVIVFVLWRRRKKKKNKSLKDEVEVVELRFDIDMKNGFEMSTGPKGFSYKELSRSTGEFSENEKLGEGGFGGVYKGFLKDSNTFIAVKRVSKGSQQGIKEYASEVKIISRLRHRNLVQLIGWCHEKGELLLVYEFMENGSLDSHLFKEKSLLTWGTRYKIAHGLACALLYLHEEWEQCVLHRDIKSSNVMLDSNFNTKLGDFGLAKLVDHEKGSHTTMLAGTLGYMAPECVVTGKATKESDVFSFGVVALEIACGRKPIEYKAPEKQIRLVQWVWELYGSDALLEAVDPRLVLDFEEEEIKRLMILGLWCVHPGSDFRPSMRQVVNVLNFEVSLPILPSNMPVASYFSPPVSSVYDVTSVVQNQTSSSD